jgi:hypothetical protein
MNPHDRQTGLNKLFRTILESFYRFVQFILFHVIRAYADYCFG